MGENSENQMENADGATPSNEKFSPAQLSNSFQGSKPKKAKLLIVIGFLIAGLLLFWMGGLAIRLQRSLKEAESSLLKERTRAASIGLPTIEDPSRFYFTRLPSTSKLENVWFFHIPANTAYKVVFSCGAYQGFGPAELPGQSIVVDTINSSPTPQEMIYTLSIRPELTSGQSVFSEVKETLSAKPGELNVTLRVPGSSFPLWGNAKDYFLDQAIGTTFFELPGGKEAVVVDPSAKVLLALERRITYPQEVNAGVLSVGEWLASRKDPGRGYSIWLEPASADEQQSSNQAENPRQK
jgi:hypothetical protein